MADDFALLATAKDSPADNAAVITPGAGPLAKATRAIYCGADGDVTAVMVGGQTITFKNMKAGIFYPLRITEVTVAAGGNLVALW
jgi:hypothetical protein